MSDGSKRSALWSLTLTILIVFALVKAGWTVVDFFFLPDSETGSVSRSSIRSLPHNFRVVSNEALPKPVLKKKPKIRASIRDLKLLAVYRGEGQSLAVIQKASRALVVKKGERVFGYLLNEIDDRSVLLERNGKEYRLAIETPKVGSHAKLMPLSTPPGPFTKPPGNPQEIRKEGETLVVPKRLLSQYTRNIDKIWSNIGIDPVQKNGKLEGFRVRYVRRRSVFAKLGLKRGDLIVGINGEPIEDFETVQDLFREAQDLDSLTLTIKRGQKEMELDYEIR
ncbi:PDZ domain-containing protein [Nitratifractor sp.]